MMEKLDKLIDSYMQVKKSVLNKNSPSKDKEEYEMALREKVKQEVINEIKQKFESEIIAQAEEKIKEKVNSERLKQLKQLMWNGLFLAFFAGLAVNQVTDIIGYYKGTVDLDNIWPTILLSIVFVAVSLAMYVYSFIKDVIKMYKEIKNVDQQL